MNNNINIKADDLNYNIIKNSNSKIINYEITKCIMDFYH